ncbi:MAG: formate--tetrahydrofolate ligase [Bacilli bacterium]|nr:formate--tetrahydrofolate ligase [Bacilli bacterium]
MLTDIEIAQKTKMKKVSSIANKIGIKDAVEFYGDYKGKINVDKVNGEPGKLILVTATSPTPFGEGKTTVSIGLLDALCKRGYNAMAALREPSLGPVFGIKGGATGGGYSQVLPMEEINLHFTGDFHAITSANNLLCAAIDNHIYQGNALNLDENNIVFNRCLDVNDRALKDITINSKDYNRKEKFDITAASEIMAIFCLAKDMDDLRKRLDNILIGYTKDNKPVFAKELNVTGSMLVLLKEAIKPNLVQTLEHNPVIIHGGPFANIAHGCNSIIATNTARKLADYTVTEAGFGADLGALKFFDIKCRQNNIYPDCVVLVTTIRGLKYNGEDDLVKGLENLRAHIIILKNFHSNIVVALNKFATDTKKEIDTVREFVEGEGLEFALSTAFLHGGKGALDLADKVVKLTERDYKRHELYKVSDSIEDKISRVVKDIYKAGNIIYSEKALAKIQDIKNNKLDKLPIVVAKTQYSISDDAKTLGYPKDFEVTIKDIKLYNGAGFITVYLGNIITMPGLPKVPNYEHITIEGDKIIGLS